MYSIFMAILCTVTVHASGIDDCPNQLSRKQLFEHGNVCIQVESHENFWERSRYFCTSKGGDLVQIRNSDMQHFLEQAIRTLGTDYNGYWIGATDVAQEGNWSWVQGGSLSSYSNWDSGEGPDHHGGGFLYSHTASTENCAVLLPNKHYKWHDYNCKSFHASICQYNKTTSV